LGTFVFPGGTQPPSIWPGASLLAGPESGSGG